MNFYHKLTTAIAHHQSLLCVRLDPDPDVLSQETVPTQEALIASLEQGLRSLLQETSDLVCAYKLIPEFYIALGTPGMELLQRILAAIPPHIPLILDAKYAHLNTSSRFAETLFEDWQVDAVTLSPYVGQDQAAPFLVYPEKAVFVLCATANPSARLLQDYPSPDRPFFLHLIESVKTWGTPEQLGLEVGATPEILAQIRQTAPERWILLQDTWQDEAELAQLLEVGLNASGEGVMVLVPKEVLGTSQPALAIRDLRDRVNQLRTQITCQNPHCDLWLPDVSSPHKHPHEDLILQLFDLGCIQFGDYVQASGATFPYYVDLRTIISNPQVFDAVISAYAEILQMLAFDRIAGIPYGSLPTATGLSLKLNHPMIFPRKEVKAHGTRRLVEGHFSPGETAVVVDDILISGKSAIEGAEKLKSVGLQVSDIVVFIDHGNGVKERLKQEGYQAHSVLTLSEITETLYQSERLTDEQWHALSHAN